MVARVIYNKEVLPTYYLLGLGYGGRTAPSPGQFYMLKVNRGIDPFLRRPFGAYRVIRPDNGEDAVEILYKVVGKGTMLMSELCPGDGVDLLGPLGRGFHLHGGRGKHIMVAGGVGIVPFYILAERLICQEAGRAVLLFGGRGKEDLPGLGDFGKLGLVVKVATDNGEVGRRCLVTELLADEITGDSVVYACGPKGMLREVAGIAAEKNVPCYVSLDRVMACGVGACLGCAVRVALPPSYAEHEEGRMDVQPYKMVCRDGPVFDSREIEWDKL